MRFCAWLTAALVLAAAAAPAQADRTIGADDYLDRLRGMWLGQILGNYAGRPREGWTARGGLAYEVPWESVAATDPWVGDDDTGFEYMNLSLLNASTSPTAAQIQDAWVAHVPLPSFFIANRQARWLMDYGLTVPDTGSFRNNMHAWAIDSQITTEALGAAAPGMRQRASDLAAAFGGVTNDGYALHAAQFYAAMYAAAPLETNVETIVAKGLEVVPTTSRTYQIIQDVRGWYTDDAGAGGLDWRATQEKIFDKYGCSTSEGGRYRGTWVESAVNTALTTMAILYGQGEFKQTVEIGVQGGFDADCNPATAGGLIGLMKGYTGLPADLTAAATDTYEVATLVGVTTPTTITQVAADWQTAAEQQILDAGGTIEGTGAGRTYHLPGADTVTPPPVKPDPSGPAGLVGEVLGLGGTVTTSASINRHDADLDRSNLDQIIDGITDTTHNGHLPYRTYDGDNAQPLGGDWYQLDFGRDLTFTSLVFYEGDIRWNGINSDPRVTEPRGATSWT